MGGRVFFVEPDPALYLVQISVTRNLFRAENLPGVIEQSATDPSALQGGLGLMSGDAVGGAIYLLPAVAVTTPQQLGIVAHRGLGTMVALFPRPLDAPDSLSYHTLADLQRPRYFTRPESGRDDSRQGTGRRR